MNTNHSHQCAPHAHAHATVKVQIGAGLDRQCHARIHIQIVRNPIWSITLVDGRIRAIRAAQRLFDRLRYAYWCK